MKFKFFFLCVLFCLCVLTFLVSGCSVTISSNDTLQLNFTELDDKTVSLIAEFESEQEDNVAGDVTQKTGSVCAGGACIVY